MRALSRRRFMSSSAAFGAYFLSKGLKTQDSRTVKPNVVIVLTDDHGYGDMSCHGNPHLKTPAIDRWHSESARFTDFHAAPMCTPTRAQLMTGMDALHCGATSVCYGRSFIRRGIPTMAEAFAANGYRTGLFGKWHLGDYVPHRPMDRGFQEAVYFLGFGLNSAPEFNNDYFNGRCLHNGKPGRFKGYCTDFWFNEAMGWMRERAVKKEPFFLYLPTNAPHGPLWVSPRYSDMYQKEGLPAAFYGMIANLDENIGRLEAFLQETGLRDDTILVFMTDNGGTAGVNAFNAGMRGRKTQLYEGGHRVPCFVRWPAGGLRTACDIGIPAQMQDILPTLIDLCGLEPPSAAPFDGTSLSGFLQNRAAVLPDRMLVVQYGQEIKKWDSCVIWNRWRLVEGQELYDIKNDPGQTTDVAQGHLEILEKMRAHYELWWSKVEPGLREHETLTIGSDRQNPVCLTSSDWQGVYCDNTNSVRNGLGGPRGGPWNVWVERSGDYEIALRRWPRETRLALADAAAEEPMTVAKHIAGKALPIARARLRIAGADLDRTCPAGARAAVFHVPLAAGQKTQLQGWFQDSEGNDVCGAYYAYVQRK